jgi:hypothetical protein
MRLIIGIVLGMFLILVWQDPANAFQQVETGYDTIKELVIQGVQRFKSGG